MSKVINISLILCTFMVVIGCELSNRKAPVSVSWQVSVPDINKSNNNEHRFVIKNISNTPLSRNWSLFYSQFPMKSCKQQSNMVKVENVKGTFHRIFPKENYKLLNPGDSIILIISGRGEMPGYSMKPEGVYWVDESQRCLQEWAGRVRAGQRAEALRAGWVLEQQLSPPAALRCLCS